MLHIRYTKSLYIFILFYYSITFIFICSFIIFCCFSCCRILSYSSFFFLWSSFRSYSFLVLSFYTISNAFFNWFTCNIVWVILLFCFTCVSYCNDKFKELLLLLTLGVGLGLFKGETSVSDYDKFSAKYPLPDFLWSSYINLLFNVVNSMFKSIILL